METQSREYHAKSRQTTSQGWAKYYITFMGIQMQDTSLEMYQITSAITSLKNRIYTQNTNATGVFERL